MSPALLPREHGAYALVGFPLATGLVLGDPGVAAYGFAIAGVLAFLAHEPFAVMLGNRGARLQADLATVAKRRATALALSAVMAGLMGMVAAPATARVAIVVPLVLGGVLTAAAVKNRLKTLLSELVMATAFASLLVPIGLAGETSWREAITAAAVWMIAFTLATLTVHEVKARTKPILTNRWALWVAPLTALMLMAASPLVILTELAPMSIVLALTPPAITSLAVHLLRVRTQRLKNVGWSIVGANTATLVLLLVA